MIGYFINYRQNLLGADQRNYVVAGYFQSMNICKVIVQLVLAYYTRNYYLWVLIELSFGIIYSFVLNWKINRTYPWLRTEVSRGKELLKVHSIVWTKTKQVFFQKISFFIQFQTVPFLIYAFVNLQTVAFYGNYTIITEKLSSFVNAFLESSGASIGNLIAEGNRMKIVELFWELICFRYFIGALFSFAILFFLEPFINIWLGQEYILPSTILYLVSINVFIGYTRGGVMQFLFGYGMYQDVWAPVCECVINFSVAVICGSFWGLEGILLGGIVSQILVIGLWKPYFLFHKGFQLPIRLYWMKIIIIIIEILMPAIIISRFIIPKLSINPYSGYVSWALFSLIILSLYGLSILSILYVTFPQMRNFIKRFINIRKKNIV
jgi:O-antigen/teichoic acid export membrane protein